MKIPNKIVPPFTPNRRKKNLRFILACHDGKRCKHCGFRNFKNLSVDHIVPRIFGGTDDLENLQILCRPCHNRKDKKIPVLIDLAKKEGWTIGTFVGSRSLTYQLINLPATPIDK